MSYVLEVLLVVAFGFAICTLVAGLAMLIVPDKLHSLAARLDITISTEKYFAVFDKTKHVDRYFYKYHLVFGAFIIIGATYTVLMLVDSPTPYHVLPEIINPIVSEWLYDTMILFLVLINGLVFFIGVIVLIRPSGLKAFETRMNTWIDTSGLIQHLDTQRMLEQQKPLKRPRLYGLIVFVGSVYVLWIIAPYIF